MLLQDQIDQVANDWNRTKNIKYKQLWYKLIKEYVNGFNNTERRNLPSRRSDKTDDSHYKVI
jgi:hypothetical protein